MRFLVTNDDGIFAPGAAALVEVLQHFGEVYVVCPDQERSSVSHSITLRRPLIATSISMFGDNVRSWAVNGTPVDCIKFGLEVLRPEKIDYVISGINLGANLGRDVYYSGTISAAVEGLLFNIPSISVSLDGYDVNKINYHLPKQLLYITLKKVFENSFTEKILLNINLPYVSKEESPGIKVTVLDLSVSRYGYVEMSDQNGQMMGWLKDNLQQLKMFTPDSDYAYLKENYVTITPLRGIFSLKKDIAHLQTLLNETKIADPFEEEIACEKDQSF